MSEEPSRQSLEPEARAAFRRLEAAIATRAASGQAMGNGRGAAGSTAWSGLDPDGLERFEWPFQPAAPTEIERKDNYRLADFLRFHDEDFIRNAYRGVLRRDPDPTGHARFLHALRTGHYGKSEILGRMRYSAEGRARGVPIAGLAPAFALRLARRIPVLGRLLGIVQYLLRLPDIVRNHERLEAVVFQHRQEFVRQLNHAATSIERAVAEQQERSTRLVESSRAEFAQMRRETFSAERGAALEGGFSTQAERLATLADLLRTLNSAKADREAFEHAIAAQAERLAALADFLTTINAAKTDRSVFEQQVAAWDARAALLQKVTEAHGQAIEQGAQVLEQTKLALDARLESGFAMADAHVAELRQMAAGLAARKAEQAALDHLFNRIDQADAQTERWKVEFAEVRGRADDAMRGVLAQERKLRAVLEQMAREPTSGAASAVLGAAQSAEAEHLLDAIYVAFEDRFRGSREEIRARTAVYLPVIAEAGAGTAASPVLDIGCGRGEWLELLGEKGLKARGVDSNGNLAVYCRELGLDVVEGDALAYLRTLLDGSLGAVSAMHVVEHMPFERMIVLLDEILRVLQPGGALILETPNPENLIVGACSFHYDPTHKHPIPPLTLQFAAETRGFASVSVMRLHPYPESETLMDGPELMRRRLNDLLFGPQDYAIVAFKPVAAVP